MNHVDRVIDVRLILVLLAGIQASFLATIKAIIWCIEWSVMIV